MEDFADEIEYFGLAPVAFVAEIQESLNDTLNEIFREFPSLPSKIRTRVYDLFRRNLVIFSSFVLRNILKFPNGFHLERKITDRHIENSVPELIKAVTREQQRELALRLKKQELQEELNEAIHMKNGYERLLSEKDCFIAMIESARNLQRVFADIGEIYGNLKIGTSQKQTSFDRLMEYKLVKSEYYREERERANKIASIEILDKLADCI